MTLQRPYLCERLQALVLALGLLVPGVGFPAPARAHDAVFSGGQSVDPNLPPDDHPRGCNDNTADTSRSTNPVLLATGEYVIEAGDLTTPEPVLRGRGGLLLSLQRSYRSGWKYKGLLGPGWDMRFNRRLRQLRNSDVLLTWGNCRRNLFAWNKTSRGWDSPPGVFSTLTQNEDSTWTQTFPDGSQHVFDFHGSLTQIRDRHQNQITFHYSAKRRPISGRSRLFVKIENRVLAREFRLERITDPSGRQVTLTYHTTSGRLASLQDWAGRKWSYEHDVWGRLVAVTGPPTKAHPKGPKTTYRYQDTNFPNHISAVIAPAGQPAAEGAAAVPRLTNKFDASGRVIEQRFSNGSVAKIAYNDTDTTVTDGTGTKWIFTTANRQITARTVVTRGVRAATKEASGTRYTTTYAYSGQKRGTQTVFPAGNAIERVYDSSNANLLARGNLLALRRVPPTGSTDPVLETRFTYKTPYQQLGTVTDPRGNKTEFFYDATTHNLTRIELPAAAPPSGGTTPPPAPPAEGSGGASGTAAPSGGGSQAAPTAAPRPTVRVQIDRHGQLTQLTSPTGQVIRLAYNAHGDMTQITRAHGTPLAATTTFTRDSLGRATAIRDSNGHTTVLQYNAWDLITKITAPSPLSYVTDLHYDLNQNLVRVERQSENADDPQTTTYTYNQRNWLTSMTNELGQVTRFAYDANGNLRTATDPASRVTTWTHDERNLLYETRDALGQTHRLFYRPNGLLAEVVDAKGQSTKYAYDSYDRLVTTSHADATSERRSYDKADNLVRWTARAGQVLSFAYDSQNRRISKVTPAGTTRYGYDLGSRLVRVAGPGATLTYAYNARDQLVTETTKPAGRTATWAVSRVYDGEDNVTKLTYPDGSAFHHVFDALNRLTAVQNAAKTPLVSHRYNSLSEMTQTDRKSGARSTYSFDEASRLSTLTHKASATATASLLSLTMARSAVGQITALTDDLGKTAFTYDAAYRLTGVQAPATAPYPDLAFAHDKAGNRKSVVATPQAAPAPAPAPPAPNPPAPAPAPAPQAPPSGDSARAGAGGASDAASEEGAGDPPAAPAPAPPAPAPTPTPPVTPQATTTAYTTNNLNQYTRVGAATYAYSRNGALNSDGTNTYRWDAENRLVGATIPGASAGAPATAVSYVYDDFDRRVKKTVGTATTYFLWSGDDLLAEYAANGTLKRRYLYGTGFAPAQVHDVAGTTTTAYDVHTDHLDTPRLLTNSTGAAVWRSRHEAFGKAHIEADLDGDGTSLAFPFRFPGQYEDPETGLHYNRHRYYSPQIGRYLSPDPARQFDSPHLYRYAANDPIHLFDPYGLYSWSQFRQDVRFVGRNSAQGAAAWADGMIPFFDPFAAAGAYNPCDPTLAWSRTAGEVSAEFNAFGRGGQLLKLFRKFGRGVKSAHAANKSAKATRAANPQDPRGYPKKLK